MPDGVGKEDVLADCYLYGDTVTFFYVFQNALSDAGLKVEVEHDFDSPSGVKKSPDFAVLDEDTITDVLDHKASLPTPELAVKDLNRLAEKYRELSHNGVPSSPRISVLYPVGKQGIIDKISKALPANLTLCSFDQTTYDTEIDFKLHGQVNSSELSDVLRGGAVSFEPSIVRSSYKFIRADPPIPYTAFHLWGVFPTFLDIKSSGQKSFVVDRDNLLQRMENFYPPWIRNNKQVNSNRVANALRFLAQIKFVEWAPGDRDVLVYSTRGTRAGDLLQYFAEKWATAHKKRARKPMGKKATIQMTLPHFP